MRKLVSYYSNEILTGNYCELSCLFQSSWALERARPQFAKKKAKEELMVETDNFNPLDLSLQEPHSFVSLQLRKKLVGPN